MAIDYTKQNTFIETSNRLSNYSTSGYSSTRPSFGSNNIRNFQMIYNYIYLYHLDKFLVIPAYSDSINDTMNVNYSSSTPLTRSAPLFSYQNSGPRSMQFTFTLHRDMMQQLNYNVSNVQLKSNVVSMNDDYLDTLINYLQACAVPNYNFANKTVNPPMVAVRMGEDIFIKGVVTSNVGVTYHLPILPSGKYAMVDLQFSVEEYDPYSADMIVTQGSWRGYTSNLSMNLQRTQTAPMTIV